MSKRSNSGCLTCKRRRRKCDEERPTCGNCRNHNRECLGYGNSLKWDVGVASRGRFQGAKVLREDLALKTPKGRDRDARPKVKGDVHAAEGRREAAIDSPGDAPQAESTSVASTTFEQMDSPWSPQSSFAASSASNQSNRALQYSSKLAIQPQNLFQEFLEVGHFALYSTEILRSPVQQIVANLSSHSRALYLSCVAVQSHLSDLAESSILNHYSDALVQYQSELETQTQQHIVATMAAGALLCTFGILRDTRWTMHLKGLSSFFVSHWSAQSAQRLEDPWLIHIIEVLAVMDMPTFVVGRTSPCLNLWTRYRLQRPSDEKRIYEDGDVEDISGLPRSLLDLISSIERAHKDDTKERLWAWKGHSGTFQQCHLWESYRFAAILRSDERHPDVTVPMSDHQDQAADDNVRARELATCRLLASLDALFTGLDDPQSHHLLMSNSVLYPLFAAGVATMASPKYTAWKSLVQTWVQRLSRENPRDNSRTVRLFLEAYGRKVEGRGNDAAVNVESVAIESDKEIALF